ncbi:hypothetical protein [Streptomyces sp. NPDC047985]
MRQEPGTAHAPRFTRSPQPKQDGPRCHRSLGETLGVCTTANSATERP